MTSNRASAAPLRISSQGTVRRIQASQRPTLSGFGELWPYRELLFFLVWRDVKVRYKQTVLGAAWAIVQPLVTMAVFSIFFGKLAGVPSDNLPYPVFAFAALVPWTFFSHGLSQGSNSLVSSANLITKVYFPRLAVPIAAVLSALVDLLLATVVLVIMMFIYGLAPGVAAIASIAFVATMIVATLGAAIWLSALNVQFRDVGYVTPFLVQVLLFLTPIAYPTSLLSEKWQVVYALNPMVGVVEGFRWSLLDTGPFPTTVVLVSLASSIVLLISGVFYFQRVERYFADVV